MEKTSAIYSNINEGSGINEKNDCVVRAITILTQKTYNEVHEVCKKHGRKQFKGTSFDTQKSVLEYFGFKYRNPNYSDEDEVLSPVIFPTVNQFIKAHPKGRFYVTRRGHAFAIIDGVIHDWARGTGSRSRITKCYALD